MNLSKILAHNHEQIALVIGNGINRYSSASSDGSWHSLLTNVASKYFGTKRLPIGENGISLTEFYDLLEIAATDVGVKRFVLRTEFCDQMRSWEPCDHHKAIVSWARRNGVPILTTNFDRVLRKSSPNIARYWTSTKRRTDFYPWECHYAPEKMSNPESNFAIWHINGMQRYPRSIRLSLTDYMGSVRRARRWLHTSKEGALFRTRDISNWLGKRTWLQIIMTKRLVIMGLALDENEVFLRWLLIERKKYFQRCKHESPRSWFICRDNISPGKQFFLENIGITPVRVSEYEDIYDPAIWS